MKLNRPFSSCILNARNSLLFVRLFICYSRWETREKFGNKENITFRKKIGHRKRFSSSFTTNLTGLIGLKILGYFGYSVIYSVAKYPQKGVLN